MAQDIAVLWDSSKQVGDLQYKDGDLLREDGLTTAVLLSLFCDSRARDESGITDPDAKRGWWGDLLEPVQNVAGLGSNLWLLGRDKATQNAMNLAEQYIREALQWMLDDGVVQDIQVDVSAQGPVETRVMAVSIRLSFASGATQVIEFADLWTAQFSDTYYLNTGAK